ncbi:MAG: two-component system response regulator [Thalassobius sp.]|nr:two-component system response regulator [Thalassovita sp.]
MDFKILYIDDDHFMRMFFEGYFESKFDIKVCDSAEDAWKIFRTGYKADLIVLDLVLPGQSGKSFLTELKKQKALADIPVIVLSGNDKSNTRIDMLKAGADDFIIKPFNPEELEIKIAKITSKIEKKLNPQYLKNSNKILGIK